jgi:gentisate 1,2-dioxygenase
MVRVDKEVHERMSMEHIAFGKEELERRRRSPVLVRAEEIEAQFREHPHVYIVDPRLGFNQRTFRFWINRRTPGEDTQVGRKTLGHRHTVEAVIHILQGEGYSVIDGTRYSWQAGDFLCVPVFAWHLHVPEPHKEWVDVAATTGPFSMATGIALYEDERYPEYWVFASKSKEAIKTLIPGGAEGPPAGSNVHFEPDQWRPKELERSGRPTASQLYYEQLIYAREEELRRREGRVLVKGSDLIFEPTAMGRIAYVVDPRLGFNVKLLSTLVAEIPPGKHSGAHRHIYEEVNYILAGSGYSIIEDHKYQWKKGDTLVIPIFGWHQHFNTGNENARFLVHTSRVAMENTGYVYTQQGEEANY